MFVLNSVLPVLARYSICPRTKGIQEALIKEILLLMPFL